jgi:Protein of unknown function (DUF2815)
MAAKKESVTSDKIRLRGRGAFLKIDKPKPYEEGATPRWEATVLLDPASKAGLESIKLLFATAGKLCKEAYDGVVPLALKKLAAQFVPGQAEPDPKTKDDGIKLAFYNGDTKKYDGYAGMLAVPAHEYEDRPKPAIASRKGVAVSPGEDQYPYSGSEIIMSVTLWGQDNKNGKRVGINLRGVQFVADGEPFSGGGEHSAEEEFEALEDEASANAGGDDLGFDS